MRGAAVTFAAIALAFGQQVGLFASLSPGSWPHHAAGAVLSGVFSGKAAADVYIVFGMLLGFMFVADRFGSRSLWKQLGERFASIRTNKNLLLWLGWTMFGTSLLVMLFGWFALVPVSLALLCLLTAGDGAVFLWIWILLATSFLLAIPLGQPLLRPVSTALFYLLVALLIGAIRSPVRQAAALALVALLTGFYWGFDLPGSTYTYRCRGDGELVMLSGERVACVTWKDVPGRELILVQGPAASTVVRSDDVEPESRSRTLYGY